MSLPHTIVLATRNHAKGIEMAQILSDTGIRVLTLADFPEVLAAPEPEETGCTYMENALIKAHDTCTRTGIVAVADDAGLEIDALDGQPGVYSKRFLGEETAFPVKMTRVLTLMKDTPEEQRGCRFQCAVAIVTPDGREYECTGVCEGKVAHEQRGEYGFGYDPIFYLPQLGRHMAELRPEEKHEISHRGMALAKAKMVLQRLFAGE